MNETGQNKAEQKLEPDVPKEFPGMTECDPE